MCYIGFVSKSTYSISKAQANSPAICRSRDTTPITRSGEVVAFVVPKGRMEALLEQMEILANPEAMKAISNAEAGLGKMYNAKDLPE